MTRIKDSIGEFKYTHIHIEGRGQRIEWDNPPPVGTKLISRFGNEKQVVDYIGDAGMIVHTGENGCQNASFPHDLDAV